MPAKAHKKAVPGKDGFEWGCWRIPWVVGGRNPSHRGEEWAV